MYLGSYSYSCDLRNLSTRGSNARRYQAENMNAEVPPQEPQGAQAPDAEGDMSNVEIRVAFQTLTQLMTTQAQFITTQSQAIMNHPKGGVGLQVNPNASTQLLEFEISLG